MAPGIPTAELVAIDALLGACVVSFLVAFCVDRVCVMLERIHGYRKEN